MKQQTYTSGKGEKNQVDNIIKWNAFYSSYSNEHLWGPSVYFSSTRIMLHYISKQYHYPSNHENYHLKGKGKIWLSINTPNKLPIYNSKMHLTSIFITWLQETSFISSLFSSFFSSFIFFIHLFSSMVNLNLFDFFLVITVAVHLLYFSTDNLPKNVFYCPYIFSPILVNRFHSCLIIFLLDQ